MLACPDAAAEARRACRQRVYQRARRVAAGLAVACGLALGWPGPGAVASTPADDFPNRPITIIVTFPPGGGTDLLARRLGAELARDLGQPVIVENRPGASGNLGAQTVAKAAPDGYTLLMVNSSYAINPGVYRNLPFSPERDLRAVINVAFVPSVFVVPAASPLRTLAQALDAAGGLDAVAPPPLPYASCDNGTPQHL